MVRSLPKQALRVLFALVLSAPATRAEAQTTVVLPDTTQTTLFTATVAEQARIVVPASVAFAVTNVATNTSATPATVTADRIVLSSPTKQLKVSLQAASASFTPPVVGATTWSASDVTWNSAMWTRATGAAGALSAVSFTQIATCDPGAADCSTTDLIFTLGAKPTVSQSGVHTLVVIWKFESI
jgi:hypothetical protein